MERFTIAREATWSNPWACRESWTLATTVMPLKAESCQLGSDSKAPVLLQNAPSIACKAIPSRTSRHNRSQELANLMVFRTHPGSQLRVLIASELALTLMRDATLQLTAHRTPCLKSKTVSMKTLMQKALFPRTPKRKRWCQVKIWQTSRKADQAWKWLALPSSTPPNRVRLEASSQTKRASSLCTRECKWDARLMQTRKAMPRASESERAPMQTSTRDASSMLSTSSTRRNLRRWARCCASLKHSTRTTLPFWPTISMVKFAFKKTKAAKRMRQVTRSMSWCPEESILLEKTTSWRLCLASHLPTSLWSFP